MLRFLAINVHDAECISASGGKCNIVTFIFSAFCDVIVLLVIKLLVIKMFPIFAEE